MHFILSSKTMFFKLEGVCPVEAWGGGVMTAVGSFHCQVTSTRWRQFKNTTNFFTNHFVTGLPVKPKPSAAQVHSSHQKDCRESKLGDDCRKAKPL